jgi:DNA-directed RNA polymerase subunit M/transcription elongation factor TFIIS
VIKIYTAMSEAGTMSETATTMTAQCPKCRQQLIYVTSVPHPKAPEMHRTTFVCYSCNRTWSYALSPAMAEAYSAASERLAAPL